MADIAIQDLIKAGVHFGHKASRWNPKMGKYIYGKRQQIHIINLAETLKGLFIAERFLKRVAQRDKSILFVGTKRQAKSTIEGEAKRCGMHFVSDRWLGGTLTNFTTIRRRVSRLDEIENILSNGTAGHILSKKMISSYQRERRKIYRDLVGVRQMSVLPHAVVVVDPRREINVVQEARKLNIPIVALIDTDCDPDRVDICIPGNDDALRSIQIILRSLTDAIVAGKQLAAPPPPIASTDGVKTASKSENEAVATKVKREPQALPVKEKEEVAP